MCGNGGGVMHINRWVWGQMGSRNRASGGGQFSRFGFGFITHI